MSGRKAVDAETQTAQHREGQEDKTNFKLSTDEDILYRVTIQNIVDGDTVDVSIDLGFSIRFDTRVRLYGINAYETRTRNSEEKQKGLLAKQVLTDWLTKAESIYCQFNRKRGKFGRYLGRIYILESLESNINSKYVCVNDMLVQEGHAVYKQY